MSSLDRLNRYLAEFRGDTPAMMTDIQLKMELGYQLMQVITPGAEDELTHLPMSALELKEVFEGATWHYSEAWTDFPQSRIMTSDGQVGVVSFKDQLTYEIVDEPLSNVG